MKFKSALVAVGLIALASLEPACALKGARHDVATATLTAHGAFKLAWETESALRCGQPTAPAVACISPELDKTLAKKFEVAAGYDADILRLVAAAPDTEKLPQVDEAKLVEFTAKLYALIREILADLPKSPQKASLENSLKGAK